VYFEVFGDIRYAIKRERQIKTWLRSKKIGLIESTNRDWKDLSKDWYGAEQPGRHRDLASSSAVQDRKAS
jgi:hypothetical protein